MPSYLVTIRMSVDLPSVAMSLAEAIATGNCEAVRTGLVRTKLESVVDADAPAEAVAAACAPLSPAVLDHLRQQWRADARDEAKLVLREFTQFLARRIP